MTRRILLLAVLALALGRVASAQHQARWNVYVYMDAQPDLEDFALKDLEELKAAGSSPDVHVFVQLALPGQPVRRYQIQQGAARVVDELGAIAPSDPRNLVDFVTWAAGRQPARRHCVVVWGHGAELSRTRAAEALARSEEAVPRGLELRLLGQAAWEIRQALGRRVDVWGYDSCLMQRVEVGYELRRAARYMVASQDTIDREDWDYFGWLSSLLDQPSMDGAELALTITRASAQAPSGEERLIAAVDLARYRALAASVSELGGELLRFGSDRGQMASLVTAHYKTRRYAGEGEGSATVDLEDLARRFLAPEYPPELKQAAQAVQQAVKAAVLLSFGDARSSGISIHHQIRPQLPGEYAALQFARDTSWDEYLSGQAGAQTPGASEQGKSWRVRVQEMIPDGQPQGLVSTLAVEESGQVRSVRLFLNLRHEYVGDLQVVLVAPSGRSAVVLDRVGGNGRNIRGWVDGEEISRLFQGEAAQGDWQLRVVDRSVEDVGLLVAWKLELQLQQSASPALRAGRRLNES